MQPPADDDEDWAPEASEESEPSNGEASLRWEEPPTAADDNPWVSEASDWPPRSDDQADFRGPSQESLADEYPKAPGLHERPTTPYARPEDGEGRRPIADMGPLGAASRGGYVALDDRRARRDEEAEAAAADIDGHAWTAANEWPGSEDGAATGGEHEAAAEGVPWERARSLRDGERDALDPPPDPAVEALDAIGAARSHEPAPGVAWTESGMSHRLREAIASVRRISIGGRRAANDRPPEHVGLEEGLEQPALREAPEEPVPSETPEELASWEAPEPNAGSATPEDFVPWRPLEREPLVPGAAEGRRGVRVAALVVASAVVLLVGSGLGVLLAGWHLQLPTGAAPSESAAPPAVSPPPPPITDVVRLQPPPRPPAPEDAPPAVESALPLPPPPKPAPASNAAPQGSAPRDLIGDAIDALLRETKRSNGTAAAAAPRVLVHYTANAASGPATAMHLVRQLKAAGFAVEARQVDRPIASPSVRYFFAADRDEAEALLSSLEGQWPGGDAPPVLDLTDSRPKPPPGYLEVWVGS